MTRRDPHLEQDKNHRDRDSKADRTEIRRNTTPQHRYVNDLKGGGHHQSARDKKMQPRHPPAQPTASRPDLSPPAPQSSQTPSFDQKRAGQDK